MKQNFKPNYVVIPALVALTSALGSAITNTGLREWYQTLNFPSFTPPGSVIGAVWTVLFILSAISILLVWNNTKHDTRFSVIVEFFILNGLLNISWSALFFGRHEVGIAVWGAALLGLSVFVLMWLIWPRSRVAALLLLPYALWVTFATYLTYSIYIIN